jgi:hypothetical protein
MIKTKKVSVQVEQPTEIECDKCHTVYDVSDYFEVQEFLHINFVGGFSSIFGDGNKVECDICQHCLATMISGLYRITPT